MDPTLSTLAPAAIDNLYHVGHLVPDLLEAMDSLGRRLQITWARERVNLAALPFRNLRHDVGGCSEPVDAEFFRIAGFEQ